MNNSIEQTIMDFLSDTQSLVSRVDELPYSTAVELYDLLDTTAKTATENNTIMNVIAANARLFLRSLSHTSRNWLFFLTLPAVRSF